MSVDSTAFDTFALDFTSTIDQMATSAEAVLSPITQLQEQLLAVSEAVASNSAAFKEAQTSTVDPSQLIPDPKKMKKSKKGMDGLLSSLGLGFLEAANPIMLVIGALQALGFLQPIVDTIMGLVSILSIGLAPILDVVLELLFSLTPIFEGVSAVIEPLAMILSAALMPIIGMLTPLFASLMGVLDPLMLVIIPIIQIVANLFMVFEPITPLLSILIPIINIFASVLGFVLTPLTSVMNLFSDVTGVFVIVKEAFVNIIATVGGVIETFFTGIVDFMANMLSSITNFFPNIISKLKDGIDDAIESFGDFAGDLGGKIKDTISGWFS